MRQLLLLSSTRHHGYEPLAYCMQEIKAFWGEGASLLFVPFAAADHEAYAQKVSAVLEPQGFNVSSLHTHNDPQKAIQQAEGIFVGGGNTFLLLKTLYELGLVSLIHEEVMQGRLKYMGSSAGSNVACITMNTTNDMPIVYPPSFNAINLVPFNINPHYLDPLPNSTHQGETREQRIQEFHEQHQTPVLGLREGALLAVTGDKMTLKGVEGARLFRPQRVPEEFSVGADLSFLLNVG